jgi:hypothetical protein
VLSRFLLAAGMLAGALTTLIAVPAETSAQWRVLYFYDELQSSLVINDFKFMTAERGIAAGFLVDRKGKIKATAITSNDGGAHWTLVPLKEVPLSVFFLDENRGWMVGDKFLWSSADGGRTWLKLSELDDAVRVHFANQEHGWAVGEQKTVYETTDGGKAWKPVSAAAKPESTPERTLYNWIDFANPKVGIVTGWNQPPGRNSSGLPEWMNPDSTRFRKETPRVSIFLQTRDSGKTWDATTGSLFGHVTCVRLSPAGFGLGLIEFSEAFEWPSEVFRINWTTGKSERVFREKNRLITDVALPPTGAAYLAGIEKMDKLIDSPVPGKLKVMKSDDWSNWQEMEVDYRATAHRALLSAVDDRNIWVATDTGMILKLAAPK